MRINGIFFYLKLFVMENIRYLCKRVNIMKV